MKPVKAFSFPQLFPERVTGAARTPTSVQGAGGGYPTLSPEGGLRPLGSRKMAATSRRHSVGHLTVGTERGRSFPFYR